MNRLKWWIRHCFKIKDCKHCCLWCQYYKSCSTDWAEPVKKEKPHYDFDTSKVKAGIMTVDKLEAKVLSYDPKIFINDHLNPKLYKALFHEEETKNAFISRQAVIDYVEEDTYGDDDWFEDGVGNFKKFLMGLPTIRPNVKTVEQRSYKKFRHEETLSWIPVSERLPGEKGYYLTTTMYHEVYCDYWDENFNRTEAVIAWMPLPKPYKAEREEEE